MRIKYSPDASGKLRQIRKSAGQKKISRITKSIRGLLGAPYKCPTVERMIGISNPYYFLHVEHYYVFYRVENDIIFISDIYNEREDFLWKMFGMKLRTQESEDYWGE